ncbi:unnamed protein product [Brachionus calyciflorus]|uniref:Uncharacterized protein n=1 Tax=Brachionus calyciflorus TaxID=104777 RepID=A0A814AJL9_9BILA|nr:unnamed protein product [Brachionus calyciflorus]
MSESVDLAKNVLQDQNSPINSNVEKVCKRKKKKSKPKSDGLLDIINEHTKRAKLDGENFQIQNFKCLDLDMKKFPLCQDCLDNCKNQNIEENNECRFLGWRKLNLSESNSKKIFDFLDLDDCEENDLKVWDLNKINSDESVEDLEKIMLIIGEQFLKLIKDEINFSEKFLNKQI